MPPPPSPSDSLSSPWKLGSPEHLGCHRDSGLSVPGDDTSRLDGAVPVSPKDIARLAVGVFYHTEHLNLIEGRGGEGKSVYQGGSDKVTCANQQRWH